MASNPSRLRCTRKTGEGRRMFAHSGLIFTLMVCLAGTVGAGETKGTKTDDGGVPFAKLADSFRQAHGIDSTGDRAALEQVLGKDYVALQVGLFDVRYPASFLTDQKKAADLIDCTAALLDLQEHWLAWLGSDAKSDERNDVRALQKWVRSWKP